MSSAFSEAALRAFMRDRIAFALDRPAADIDDDADFEAMGLPSLEAVEFAGALEDHLGRPIEADLLFEHPTIARLAAALAEPARAA